MCGIAAMIALDGSSPDTAALARMTSVLRHRGPDDFGYHVTGPVALGFRRLSILDLTPSGHQPMVGGDGQLVLVFNGEIYNYLELRGELQALGHTFRSTGDTEVLLRAYEQWGAACVHRFNGMWAFLIYDHRERKIFGSRDRFGVKPLYRYRSRERVLFASEIKAILASGYYRGGPDWKTVASFLYRGRLEFVDRTNETFYDGIEQVPAGTAFEVALDGRQAEWRFWSLADVQREDVVEPCDVFRDVLDSAVRLRMRSDVPVGVSLSGGLDSTSIAAIMARYRAIAGPGAPPPAAFKAFSYMPREFDESSYIARIVEHTGIELNAVAVDSSRLWDRLDRILWFHDEPMHSLTALVQFEVYRAAASHGVRVLLSGQGADETVAGYPPFFVNYWYTLLRSGRIDAVRREIAAYCRAHGGDEALLFRSVARALLGSALRVLPLYDARARLRRRAELRGHPWFAPELWERLPPEAESAYGHTLDDALRRAIEIAPLPLYLRIEDRNSMAHSVEARLPFLDYRLVSLVFSLPPRWRIRGPLNKYVLRQAMRGRVPELVRARVDKMGFPTPAREWFRGVLYEPMRDMLASQELRTRGIYNVAAIARDLDRHRSGELDASSALFNIAQLERWFALAPRPQLLPAATPATPFAAD